VALADDASIPAPARTALPRAVIVAMAAVVVVLAADVAGAFDGTWIEDWCLWGVFGLGAILCAVRAVQVPQERIAWALFSAGWGFYVAGGIVFQVALDGSTASFPSAADVLWLGLYVADIAGIAALMHARGIARKAAWLDGAVGSLAVAAVVAAFAFAPALNATDSGVVAIAYPLLDCLLVGFVVVVASAEGWRLDRTFGLLALGFVGLAGGDAQYLVSAANGEWTAGQTQNIPYVLGTLCVCVAAWQPAARVRVEEFTTRMFTTPILFGLVAVALQAYGFVVPVNAVARSLDVLAILAVVARLGFTFRDYASVLDASRREALIDAVTGLGNRRKLMRDLDDVVANEEQRLVAIFDLDGFKHYNDSFGHAAGDSLLTRLSAEFEAVSEAHGGLAYRMGGDEFCALLPDGTDLGLIAASLREDGSGFTVDCSYGCARVPCEAADAAAALRLADQRMYAVKNARPVSASSQTRDLLVRVLAEREPDLHDHVLDVGALAREVACELGIPEEDHPEIVNGAELHDVGKIAIPESILHKPGALDDEEWTYMKRHTLIGERFLLSVPALRAVGRLVRSSHERWDGAGYPDGLAGEQIPLGARIIAVCDAYDAMVTDRPYRRGTDSASALQELRRCAGSQFDPRVVDAFCAVAQRSALVTHGSAAAA
jgi:two-component system, cell cycle response regulator